MSDFHSWTPKKDQHVEKLFCSPHVHPLKRHDFSAWNDGEAVIEMFNSDCMRKRAKVGGSGGILPQENFEILHLRRSILVYFQ